MTCGTEEECNERNDGHVTDGRDEGQSNDCEGDSSVLIEKIRNRKGPRKPKKPEIGNRRIPGWLSPGISQSSKSKVCKLVCLLECLFYLFSSLFTESSQKAARYVAKEA